MSALHLRLQSCYVSKYAKKLFHENSEKFENGIWKFQKSHKSEKKGLK